MTTDPKEPSVPAAVASKNSNEGSSTTSASPLAAAPPPSISTAATTDTLQSQPPPTIKKSLKTLGNAVTATVVVADWTRSGLADRVCDHFDWTGALTPRICGSSSSSSSSVGVARGHTKTTMTWTSAETTETTVAVTTRNDDDKDKNTDAMVRPSSRLPTITTTTSTATGMQLLDCVPTKQWYKVTRRQKRDLLTAMLRFRDIHSNPNASTHTTNNANANASTAMRPIWPLRLIPQTRLWMAYETTRVAFCIDASPTLTSTFGLGPNSNSDSKDECICPMDRLVRMARTFLLAMIAPIERRMMELKQRASGSPNTTTKPNKNNNSIAWTPCLAVTILAVYPRAMKTPPSVLVRDMRVTDMASATLLARRLESWCLQHVETTIAAGLSASTVGPQSVWRDLLDAGHAALSTLSNAARPLIVVATTCRSVACESLLETVMDQTTATSHPDVPVTVLDVSHPRNGSVDANGNGIWSPVSSLSNLSNQFNLLNYDPHGAAFPLHLPDDSETIFQACQATGGSFFDHSLLMMAAQTLAGQVDNALDQDAFFAFKRYSIKPNAVQWYVLFSLSPLSPLINTSWGKLPPPVHLAKTTPSVADRNAANDGPRGSGNSEWMRLARAPVTRMASSMSSLSNTSGTNNPNDATGSAAGHTANNRFLNNRATFSNYIINPIPIKDILLMRIKEGYRAKQYGQTTSEHDRVSIQFFLPLDYGVTVHYEVSYKALPAYDDRSVGFAHIKIELSGDVGLIMSIKNEFLHHQQQQSHQQQLNQSKSGQRTGQFISVTQQFSASLCNYLRQIRKEDMLQSYLSPLSWHDQLSSSTTPFVRRLGTLSSSQLNRHFTKEEFDCVCVGRMPWEENEFLEAFSDTDDGSMKLVDAVRDWASQSILSNEFYVKKLLDQAGVAGYCVVEVVRSHIASRVFTISVSFNGTSLCCRQAAVQSLKDELVPILNVTVLSKQIGKFLVGEKARLQADPLQRYHHISLESHHNHASWDLVKDAELLPLLMKRRKEIGNFFLLESSDNHALFAKVDERRATDKVFDPGNLVQYQYKVLADKVVVELDMESESGSFFPFHDDGPSTFHRLARSLKKRDQECAHALLSRTILLQPFRDSIEDGISSTILGDLSQLACLKRLLEYSSEVRISLRFFNSHSGPANDLLQTLTSEMLLSQQLGAKVAQLSIASDTVVEGLTTGDWFIAEYDEHTMSILHLSIAEKDEVSQSDGRSGTYRELVFFTISKSDLYSRRDDVIDEDSEEDHISEHLQVSEFSGSILELHKKNFASAAYMSLVGDSPKQIDFFDLDDFYAVIRPLHFVEVSKILVARNTGSSKLESFLASSLHNIPDEKYCMYYDRQTAEGDVFVPFTNDTDSDLDSALITETLEPSMIETFQDDVCDDSTTKDGSPSLASTEFDRGELTTATTPIFVRFLLDDKPVSIQDLLLIERSATLTILLSVFETYETSSSENKKKSLPELELSHFTAAEELSALLNAYVAEQTLERLRFHGATIADIDICIAKTCLDKARNVLRSFVEIYFYVPKGDSMICASASLGASLEIEEGFNLLALEMRRKNETISLRQYGSGDRFIIQSVENKKEALDFWCFVKIRRTQGAVLIEIHHPHGPSLAAELMKTVQGMISLFCHRVNQRLLLKSLHSSKTASKYLIPPDKGELPSGGIISDLKTGVEAFHDGIFECPIVYQTSFEMYHRCASNPSQVAMKLEASVLHNFSVSNRREFFAYKDEAGSIFYLNLATGQPNDGTRIAEPTIELVVRGVDEPSSSITEQLRNLLQKRLLQIAIDMLSAVLAKNPQYHWKSSDIAFVRSFENEWNVIESERQIDGDNKVQLYSFPVTVYDPAMILLYFRQNLCGSTFFHALLRADTPNPASENVQDEPSSPQSGNFSINESDFIFYYSTSPSKLDPNFQSESTLTEKGAQFSRLAGSGVALIEVSLVGGDGMVLSRLEAALPVKEEKSDLKASLNSLRFQEVEKTLSCLDYRRTDVFVQVSITDTVLKRDILHEWVLLSLNQVLCAWHIERQLERMQKGFLRIVERDYDLMRLSSLEDAKQSEIEKIHIGLPALSELLSNSESLPHPAVVMIKHEGVVRSSAVASFAFDLLEKGILKELRYFDGKKQQALDRSHLCVIRSSRSTKPCRVYIERDSHRRIVVRSSNGIIQDSPVDCPEYTIMYYSREYGDEEENVLPKLFEEVTVGYNASGDKLESTHLLMQFKQANKLSFRRSFGFVFKVKRNRRVLLAYNWHSHVLKKISASLQTIDKAMIMSTGRSAASLQFQALGILAPNTDAGRMAPSKSRESFSHAHTANTAYSGARKISDEDAIGIESPLSVRRLKRPQIIRKPKLIGKSVEGSATQAVIRSRARASASRFRGNDPTNSSAANKSQQEGRKGRPPVGDKRNTNDARSTLKKQAVTPCESNEHLESIKKKVQVLTINQKHRSSLSMQAASIIYKFTSESWLQNQNTAFTMELVSFLFSIASLAWNEVALLPPIPHNLKKNFIESLAQTLVSWTPDLKCVPVIPIPNTNDIFLMGKIRKLRNCKCFVIVRLTTLTVRVKGDQKVLVSIERRVVNLPRRHKVNRRVQVSSNLLERASAGRDTLSADLFPFLELEGKLLDHSASLVERTMKSVSTATDYRDVLRLLLLLIEERQSLKNMMAVRSNYKCYCVTIVLSSYRDQLIDMYDGPRLFEYLSTHVDQDNVIDCGSEGLCFKREVVVGLTHSIGFLKLNPENSNKLTLVILCRTQGKNLSDFMFRESSNIAISVFDCIAFDSARLAYKCLRNAAERITKEKLWTSLSSNAVINEAEVQKQISNLLHLCSVKPIARFFDNSTESHIVSQFRNITGLINQQRCYRCMRKDPMRAFWPSWEIQGDEGVRYLFYLAAEDVFLLIGGKLWGVHNIDLVQQSDHPDSKSTAVLALHRLLNFHLHFLWSEMALQGL